jgi:phosphoserine phosphatase
MNLLVLDVEGTLFKTTVRLPGSLYDSTIWQALADALGPEAVKEEVETHRRWDSGQYRNYLEWMKDTITIHRKYGLSQQTFQKVIMSAEYNPEVVETVLKIDRSRFEPLLVSGGFRELAARAQRDLGILHAFAACSAVLQSDAM